MTEDRFINTMLTNLIKGVKTMELSTNQKYAAIAIVVLALAAIYWFVIRA